jgi:hypothetical protein
MPGSDVVDVQEHLVAALASPHLVTGVAGVAQDGPDRGLGPGTPGSVGVADPVIAGRRRDPLGGQLLSDGIAAVAGQEQLEDAGHDLGGGLVGLQPVQASADGGLARMGVFAGVGQLVAVGRAAAQETALGGRLGAHRGAHPGLDSGALAFGHAAEQGHD